ncbi:MAG TPA: efflux RND transporter periplasmic adaptor subunit, partial [Usitatibacter sp.]|nr:efflux RND transporter periplasmic adaptor subunit [Usitatibacter sp.]
MRGPIIAAVAVIAAAAGTAWWLQRAGPAYPPVASAPPPQAAQKPSVKVTHPQVARLPEVVRATGELRTAETLALRTPMPGRIAAILFKEGQRVTRGQALVKLDDAAQKAELQRARASLAEARSNHERSLQLRAKGFLPGDALRESEEAVRAASARKETLEARLALTTLRAPSPALMGQPLANVGDTVAAGQEVVDVELMDPLDLELRVPAAAVPYVRERSTLQISVQGLPGRSYAATVLAIDAAG